MQITKSNQVLQESDSNLAAEITFLKEQVAAFWQNSSDDKHILHHLKILHHASPQKTDPKHLNLRRRKQFLHLISSLQIFLQRTDFYPFKTQ